MVSGHPTQDRHVRKRKKTRTKGSPSPMKSLSVITLSVADMKPRLRDQLCHEEKGCHSHHVGVRTISETSFPPWVCHVSKCRIYSSIWEWLSKNPQIFFTKLSQIGVVFMFETNPSDLPGPGLPWLVSTWILPIITDQKTSAQEGFLFLADTINKERAFVGIKVYIIKNDVNQQDV